MEIDLNSALNSTWLLPVIGILSWALVKFLDGKFISTADFNAYKEARGEEEREYREYIDKELKGRKEHEVTLYEKIGGEGGLGERISGLESTAEALENDIKRIDNRLDK